MITVRDFYIDGQRWIVWRTTSLQRSYIDYPYAGVEGFPSVNELAGQVHVTAEQPSLPTEYLNSLQASSLWEQEGAGPVYDYVAGFNLAGHTGLWGVSILEPSQDEGALRGLVQDGEDYTPQEQGDGFGTIITTDRIEVYPLDTGLPDSMWLSVGEDLVLNSAEIF